MNRFTKRSGAILALAFFAVSLVGGTAYAGDNQKAAKGQERHRTWVVYEMEFTGSSNDLDWKIGDAFRLMTVGNGQSLKYMFKPLKTLSERWGTTQANFELAVENNTLLCGDIRMKGGWSRRLAIETAKNDIVDLYWADQDDCDHVDSHPGHARAEN